VSVRPQSHSSQPPAFITAVPDGWSLLPIRLLGRIANGATPASGDATYWDGDIVWITPDDLGKQKARYLTDSGRRLTADGYAACGTTKVPPNSLVLSIRAPIGHLAISKVEACFNQGCRAITLNEGHCPEYFYYQLQAAKSDLAALGTGSTFMELARERLASFKLIVPPPPEQRAIADFLDRETAKIDALIAKQEELIKRIEEKRQSALTHLLLRGLDDSVETADSGVQGWGFIPSHWRVLRLKLLAKTISKGTTPSTIRGDLTNTGIRFLKAENISEGQVLNVPEFYIDDTTNDALSRSKLKAHDILIVIAGATTGKSAVLHPEMIPANTNQAVCFIRLIDPECSTFVQSWLRSKFIYHQIWTQAVQSAQPNLSMENVGNLQIPVPSRNEMLAISAEIRRTEHSVMLALKQANDLRRVLIERRSALITAAITGQIEVAANLAAEAAA
jgi:type I restriction enzyme S subunit